MPENRLHHYTGLTDEQVLKSRKEHGKNLLTPPRKESLWHQFVQKFKDPIIRILLIALLLSVGVSLYEWVQGMEGITIFLEPLGIFIAVALATGIGFCLEIKANRAFDILIKVNDDTPVKVIRNGRLCQVTKKEIVTGDVVVLDTGEEIPADGYLLESVSLQVNESTLTGEPLCKKTTRQAEFNTEATYPSNRVLRGTTVVDGHCIYRVDLVGDATEYGKVYVAAQIDDTTKTPLDEQLGRLGHLISIASYVVGFLVIIGRMVMYFDEGMEFQWIDFLRYSFNSVMIAVTLIVVSVPEGLPMSVTLSLALSMRKMLQTNNLVRKMHACETMGATSVICTDKTGTLTQNQMQIHETRFYGLTGPMESGDETALLIQEAIALNSTAHLDCSNPEKIQVLGNPTEGALLLWLNSLGIDYALLRGSTPVVEQLTFSTERKYMATVVDSPLLHKRILYVKGASDILMPKCKEVNSKGKSIPADEFKNTVFSELALYQGEAMRTLGFAYKILDEHEPNPIRNGEIAVNDLTFMGIAAISDPVRADVPDAVDTCRRAGIRIIIVTGDTQGTAKEIARQINLWSGEDENRPFAIMTGADFAEMNDEELSKRAVPYLKILARARPMDKERLVGLLQQQGEVVAVTGDGTNDAPALKKAQVGLSMGDGTSVAKEAGDITIIDNSFTSIGRAVMWGRSLYKNIQRFIIFQLTVNVAACLIVLCGAFMGTEAPLTVTQMLWVNLIMDTFAAMALASLPPTQKVMQEKPRRHTSFIITRSMNRNIVGVGLAFFLTQFAILQYFKHNEVTDLSWDMISGIYHDFFNFNTVYHGLSHYELSLFFTFFVMLQFWNLFNAKAFFTGESTLSHLFNSPSFTGIAFIIIIGQILIVSFGGTMFNVTPLEPDDWFVIIVSTSVVLWIKELYRFIGKIFAKQRTAFNDQ